jgi:hypothetical protein
MLNAWALLLLHNCVCCYALIGCWFMQILQPSMHIFLIEGMGQMIQYETHVQNFNHMSHN